MIMNDVPTYDLSDLSWLVQSVDIRQVLERAGVRVTGESKDEIRGFCPDHHLFKGCEPSHPNWFLNKTTGKCHCKTEGRGSNVVYVLKRFLSLQTVADTIAYITDGSDATTLSLNSLKKTMLKLSGIT